MGTFPWDRSHLYWVEYKLKENWLITVIQLTIEMIKSWWMWNYLGEYLRATEREIEHRMDVFKYQIRSTRLVLPILINDQYNGMKREINGKLAGRKAKEQVSKYWLILRYLESRIERNGLLNMIPRDVRHQAAVVTLKIENVVDRRIKQPFSTALRAFTLFFSF